MIQHPKRIRVTQMLIGEWSIGIAMKTSNAKVLSGCGTMSAKEMPSQLGVTSEIRMHIEGVDDHFESDL